MKIKILTIFPNLAAAPLQESILKKAAEKGLVGFEILDVRESSTDKHSTVDDTPYGGGGGMVMKPEPLALAIEKAVSDVPSRRLILTSASGRTFDQAFAQELSHESSLIFVCGHYTGVDERLKEFFPLEEVSLGDFVLTGGELPALVMIDAIVRLLPGVLGNFESAENDSFAKGLLGYPQYTKPQTFRELEVPPVLVSGDHAKVAQWRRKKALERTYLSRPDLLSRVKLSLEEEKYLTTLKKD